MPKIRTILAAAEAVTVYQLELIKEEPALTPDVKRAREREARRKARKVCELQTELHKLAGELNTALDMYPRERPQIHKPEQIADLIRPFVDASDTELLIVVLLNIRNDVLAIHQLYSGSVCSAQVRIAEVLRPAIQSMAPAMIIVHNHPSGDPSASPDDVALTRAIVQAAKIMDINVLDHIIIARMGGWISLKERGLGFS